MSALSHLNYVVAALLLAAGLFVALASGNLLRRMTGVALVQAASAIFFISLGKVRGATAPIVMAHDDPFRAAVIAQQNGLGDGVRIDGVVYANPLPQVMILTAIVVGVATLAVGLAIVVRIREAYGSVRADEIDATMRSEAALPRDA